MVYVYLISLHCEAQKGTGDRPYDNGHGWDIRFAVPGEPGNDYPTLSTIPKTSFTCAKKDPGYYADVETNCQVFRICTLGSTFGFQSFLCPNGTLFNQAVFVCDWWMNVNCKKSTEYFESNEKRSKLKVGPELMTDVKNMLSHPIRNPYDKIITRDNFIDTQEYQPPFQIINPNDNVIIQNERNIDNFYVHSRPTQNTYDLSYAASTATPSHIFKSNSFQEQFTKNFEGFSNFDTFILHPTSAQNTNQFSQQKQRVVSQDQRLHQQQHNSLNSIDHGNSIGFRELTRDDDLHLKQSRFPNSLKQSSERKINEQKRLFENKNSKNILSMSKNFIPNLNKIRKQNLVSNNIGPTLITKTLAYRKTIPNPQKGQPKSRITFKTWIVKPSRNPRLVAEPTPYIYDAPLTISQDVAVDEPYIYNKPEYGLIRKVVQDNNNLNSIPTTTQSSSIINSNGRQNLITTSRPTISSRLYLAPISSVPTKASNIYLPPTTYKPVSLSYLPPTTSFSLRLQEKDNISTYATTQQSYNNRDIENLTFSEILTKEKLDLKVKNLVQDTNDILRTQTLNQNRVFNENIQINNEPPDGIYLPPLNNQESGERLTSQSQIELPKSSRLVALPSKQLEPPKQSTFNNSRYVNSVSKLPFINESVLPKNTIERTVSLQIKIPENIARILFNNRKMSNSNDLEILNTGSSNYLVLNNKNSDSFVPLGKLTWNKNSNISTSQDLVQSFIADSINAAKHYSNIVQQVPTPSTSTQTPVQSKHAEEVETLSDKISQLTSSQYSTTTSNVKSNGRQSEQLQQLTSNKPGSQHNTEEFSFDAKNILSGQLYNLPVPVVTEQIYNAPLKNSRNFQWRQNLVESVTKPKNNNEYFQQIKSITKSNIVDNVGPVTTEELTTQNSVNTKNNTPQLELIKKIENSNNRISAYINDKTTGTINHPVEDNKVITYQKDKSYFVFTNLYNNQTSKDIPIKEAQVHKDDFNLNHLTHLQYRPKSNTKEQTREENDRTQSPNRRLDFGSNVDYEVIHNSYDDNIQKSIESGPKLSRLYDGPSSYNAPQQSIGDLQNIEISDATYNSRLEDLENNNNNDNDFNGYQRERPTKRFLF